MNRITQRTKSDCGVCCVAMLADVSYEQAKTAFTFRCKGQNTTTDDCLLALKRLGMKTNRMLPIGPDNISDILNERALVKANVRTKHWHWVVYDPETKSLIDPSKTPKLPTKPSSYVVCWR